MTILTVTAKGQVTFKRDVLRHLGLKPGEKLRIELLPDGRAELSADKATGEWSELSGFLKGKTTVRLTDAQLQDAIAEAGAKAGMAGLKR